MSISHAKTRQSVFHLDLSLAMGAASSLDSAIEIWDMLEKRKAIGNATLLKAISRACQLEPTPIVDLLAHKEALKDQELLKALAMAALTSNNQGVVRGLVKQPEMKTLAQDEHGWLLVEALKIQGNDRHELLAILMGAFAFPQSALDIGLGVCLIQAKGQGTANGWDRTWATLIEAGANPLHNGFAGKPTSKSKTAADPLIFHLAKHALHMPNRGGVMLISALNDQPADLLGGRNQQGQTLAAAWCAGNGDVRALVDALDDTKTHWWDGDPFNVFPAAVTAFLHGSRTLLETMQSRAHEHGVQSGIDLAAAAKAFGALFNYRWMHGRSSGEPVSYWNAGVGGRMADLLVDERPWKKLCAWAEEIETRPERPSQKDVKLFLAHALLECTTQNAPTSAKTGPRL